jgi:phytoene synthase
MSTSAITAADLCQADLRCLADVRPVDASTLALGLRLLPIGVRNDVYRLYEALRLLDDAVDYEQHDADAQLSALEEWASGGEAKTPATLTLADLSDAYPLSPEPFIELCEAFRADLARKAIDTQEDLETYCSQVGGSVAVMVAELLGTAGAFAKAKIAILGHAMQLTNVLRDIDLDLTRGRVYIPRAAIERFGLPTPGARRELLREEIARADSLYRDGLPAIQLLARGRRGIAICAALYREILRQIERDGFGRREGIVRVPLWRQRVVASRHYLLPLTA